MPIGVEPRKAFDGMLKLKEKARVAFEMESARVRLSKLGNTVPQPVASFKAGQLVMLWRQRNKPGKTTGTWIGPVRLLLQEGNTLWLATGATLIRARTTQVRQCTRREEMKSLLEGTAILKLPVTLESLLQSFTGRHFSDVTGQVPSQEQLQQDLQGAEVRQMPQAVYRPDTWKITEEGERRWLIRVHSLPRLAMFTPSRTTSCPAAEDELTGRRVTILRGLQENSEQFEINDDYKESEDPNRSLQDRWVGETKFEMKQSVPKPGREKREKPLPVDTGQKKSKGTKAGTKRKSEAAQSSSSKRGPEHEPQDEQQGSVLPDVPGISPLTTALRDRGPSAVDGVPGVHDKPPCSTSECKLPGGHSGPHMDADGSQFTWSKQDGRVDVEPQAEELEVPSEVESEESAASSAELMTEREIHLLQDTNTTPKSKTPKEVFYALEIDVSEPDLKFLSKHPAKSSIWLSRKMQEKGRELRWSQMTLDQKQEFDIAQARELSNVLGPKALRSLSKAEFASLDPKKMLQMRWVLTRKASGEAKARLVVLGFMAPNIGEVETAAPTMARLSRNLLLAICANNGFNLQAGDVTAAFLQAEESLESQELNVWTPAELAVLFGADPNHPVMPARVSKAFYGLVQSPRCWFNDLCNTMKSIGWETILGDRCLFVLFDDSRNLIGIAGVHVDDVLIGGSSHPKFTESLQALKSKYTWGKWESEDMDFAGCHIRQSPTTKEIRIDQKDYIQKWLDEMELAPNRSKEVKSYLTASEVSQLRGVLGSAAWKASQSGPHYAADIGLLLSEVPFATVQTALKANKLVREIKRTSEQCLIFPHWGSHWQDLSIITWSDAGQQNRPDKGSTLGVLSGLAPKGILHGEEHIVAVLSWKSAKTPRQVLGSNGAEIQGITEGEDNTFKIRAMWAELHGVVLERHSMYHQVRDCTTGAIVMDSRGIFDAMSRNVSALHGLRSARAGYELSISVQQALQISTALRWVNGLAQLADCLTKGNERRSFLQFLAAGQKWRLVDDEKFTAGRKLKKKALQEAIRHQQEFFVKVLEGWSSENKWCWEPALESRNGVDVISGQHGPSIHDM